MSCLFLCAPGIEGFDGGAGSRYQARREVTSYWYPTWLAQAAALVPDSKLLDCAPHGVDLAACLAEARRHEQVIINTSIPSLFEFVHRRGCPAQCTFCPWPQTIGGHPYRVRSPENVAAEMAYLKRLFPEVREFFFDDDTFTANLPRARAIAERLRPLGLTWSCNSRANVNEETIRFLRDCGLRLFLVGYESGNDEILRNIKKGVNTEQMRVFTRACYRAGVTVHGTFILGLPVETPEKIEQTIRFAQELDVFSIQVSLAAPYPGTELYAQAQANGWFARRDIVQQGGFQNAALQYPGLDHEEIFEAVERFYQRWYFRPKPILRILRTMLADREVCVRRLREGWEFFRSMRQRTSATT